MNANDLIEKMRKDKSYIDNARDAWACKQVAFDPPHRDKKEQLTRGLKCLNGLANVGIAAAPGPVYKGIMVVVKLAVNVVQKVRAIDDRREREVRDRFASEIEKFKGERRDMEMLREIRQHETRDVC